MLTPGEMVAVNEALDRADATVVNLWGATEGFSPLAKASAWFNSFAGTRDGVQSAEDLAFSASALVSALYDLRNRALESPEYEHEMAIEIVDRADHLSGSGMYAARPSAIQAVADMQAQLEITGHGGRNLASYTAQAASDAWKSSLRTLQLIGVAILVVVTLVVVGRGKSIWKAARQ